MGRVGCIEVEGLSLWFNSNDHLPPHFHVNKTGEWEVRIYFLRCCDGWLNFDIKWGDGPSRKVQRELLTKVLVNRAALLEEWEQKVCVQK